MTWPSASCAKITNLLLTLVVIPCLWGNRLQAGEAIVFGNEKTKVEPGREKTPTLNPFRLEKLATPAPLDFGSMAPPILPQLNLNSRKDKRQQNADDEKKNWMMLEKGELQDKDDEKNFLGIREEKLEDLGKSKDSHDYTFRDSKSTRVPGHLRAPNLHGKPDASQSPAARANPEDDSDGKRASGSSAILFGTRENEPGAHSGNEFDLKNLLDRNLGKANLSIGSLFNGGETQPSREQQARSENAFKQILGGSQRSFSDPINFRADFTRQPMNPIMPSSLGDSGTKSFLGDSPAFRQTPAPANNPLNYLGSQDGSAGSSGFGVSPSAPSAWRATEVPWPKSKF